MIRIPISALINGENEAEHSPPLDQPLELIRLHNREYFLWKGQVHPFPWDEPQRDLLDILHKFIYDSALDVAERPHTVHLQPPGSRPLRILDVGYGTGHWTLDMARAYPDAQITGFDLIPFEIQPHGDNIHNLSPVDFNNPNWPLPIDSQDLIHMSLLCGSVPDWEKLYSTAYEYLRPTTGQIEHIEIDWTPRSYPHPYPSNSPASREWWKLLATSSAHRNVPMACPAESGVQKLEKCGFVDISHRRIRIPFADNPRDTYEQQLSDWFRAAMAQDGDDVTNSYAGLSLMFLTVQLGMEPEEVRRMCREVVREVNRKGTPLYCNLHVYTARKPGRPQQSYPTPTTPHHAAGPGGEWTARGQNGRHFAHM